MVNQVHQIEGLALVPGESAQKTLIDAFTSQRPIGSSGVMNHDSRRQSNVRAEANRVLSPSDPGHTVCITVPLDTDWIWKSSLSCHVVDVYRTKCAFSALIVRSDQPEKGEGCSNLNARLELLQRTIKPKVEISYGDSSEIWRNFNQFYEWPVHALDGAACPVAVLELRVCKEPPHGPQAQRIRHKQQ